MKAFESENVAGAGCHVPPGGKGHPAQEIEADPNSPGIVVIQARNRAQSAGKAQDRHRQTGQ